MSNAQQFHDMTTAELQQKYADLKNELFNLRFQQTTGQLKNPLALRTLRKDVARVLTILKEREMKIVKNQGKTAPKVAPTAKGGKK